MNPKIPTSQGFFFFFFFLKNKLVLHLQEKKNRVQDEILSSKRMKEISKGHTPYNRKDPSKRLAHSPGSMLKLIRMKKKIHFQCIDSKRRNSMMDNLFTKPNCERMLSRELNLFEPLHAWHYLSDFKSLHPWRLWRTAHIVEESWICFNGKSPNQLWNEPVGYEPHFTQFIDWGCALKNSLISFTSKRVSGKIGLKG